MNTDITFSVDDLVQIAAAMDDRVEALDRAGAGQLMAQARERCKEIKARIAALS